MTMFGLKEAPLAQLVRDVTIAGVVEAATGAYRDAVDELDRESIADRFARGTFTGIAEPGDRMAGLVVAVLGAATALQAVVDRRSAAELHAELSAAGAVVDERELAEALARWQPRLTSESAMLSFRQAARFGVRLMVPGDPDWPSALDDLELHAPIGLWRRGRDEAVHAASRASIALVGARAATGYGEHVAMEASAGLVDRGYAIVSGAAYGIDGMAHRAALASRGETVAILAGGVDRFYPSGHDALLSRIVEAGAVLSEVPCGGAPTKWRFLQRNRLIAALSHATVVLEAGWRSGSLNTAGHAGALGRPVGAVPGPVTSATSAGCHRLIREYAAVCVTNAEEMAELAPIDARSSAIRSATSEANAETARSERVPHEHTRVLDALSERSPREVDDIASRAGLSVADVHSVLGTLELDDRVAQRERGWLKRRVR